MVDSGNVNHPYTRLSPADPFFAFGLERQSPLQSLHWRRALAQRASALSFSTPKLGCLLETIGGAQTPRLEDIGKLHEKSFLFSRFSAHLFSLGPKKEPSCDDAVRDDALVSHSSIRHWEL